MSENKEKYSYLQKQWNEFQTDIDVEKLKDINENFNEYIVSIKDKRLELTAYTNIKSDGGNDYFCNFLENTSSIFYGSAKPGNAINYGIYMNDKKKYIQGKSELKEEKEEKFKEITDYLNKLVMAENIEDIVSFEQKDNRPIRANQILKKLIAYNNMGKFLFMYADDAIDRLYNFFITDANDNKANIEKNYLITNEVKNIFNKTEIMNDNEYMIILSRFIWSIFGSIIKLDSKNMILHGAPGTGKTYMVKNTIKNILLQEKGDISEQLVFTQFHPSYGYEDFIDGIKPTGISESGQVKLELKNGNFKDLCIKAKKNLKQSRENGDKPKKFFFVADEINRAELSRVFGELLIALEEDYRVDFDSEGNILNKENLITTANATLDTNPVFEIDDKKYFGVPSNLYFIGTMNDIDRSVDSFDMALRRRFKWKEIRCNYDFIDALYSNKEFTEICRNLNRYITGFKEEKSNGKVEKIDKVGKYETLSLGTSFELGHAYFKGLSKIDNKNINNLWESKLEPLLKEYLRAEYSPDIIMEKLSEAKEMFTLPKPKKETNDTNS